MSLKKGTLSGLRQMNRFTILQLIKDFGPLSRADLAQRLDLSRSIVSLIVDDLIQDGLIHEGGTGESSSLGGKRPIQLLFNPGSRYALGIDIGSTKTLFVITDMVGTVISRRKIVTPKDTDDVLREISLEAKAFLAVSGLSYEKIVGTGIGITGIVDPANGTLLQGPGLQMENIDVIKVFTGNVPSPIHVENDVNAATLGERWCGAASNQPNVVLIAIGTGIGAGIIFNNQIYKGARGAAGEIGYFQFPGSSLDESVTFHNYGYLEMLTSGAGISALAKSWLAEYPSSVLNSMAGTSEDVFQAAAAGDELANKVIEFVLQNLAVALNNIIMLLDPNVIIIGGGVAGAKGFILERIRNKVSQMTPIQCPIVLSHLGEESAAVGAAAIAFIHTRYLELY